MLGPSLRMRKKLEYPPWGYQPTQIRFMNFLFFVGKHILLILSAFTACEILISIYDVWIVHLLNFLTFYLPIL